MKKEILDIILTSRSKKQTLAVITRVADGMQWAVLENDSENHEVFTPLEIDTIKTSMRDNKSSLISDEKFFCPYLHATSSLDYHWGSSYRSISCPHGKGSWF
ncbi:hypothetical protein OAN59_10210 [Alphaproteobacteria bacterium]|nr:hypothetical protein [Alphaproteobacteria bacterium]